MNLKPRALRILSFNAWMLKLPLGIHIADDIEARKIEIPKAVARSGADIVCLQECWDPTIREFFRSEFKKEGFPYCAESTVSSFSALPSYHRHAFATSIFGLFLNQAGMVTASGHHAPIQAASGVLLGACAVSSVGVNGLRERLGNGLQIFSKYPLDEKTETLVFNEHTRPDEFFTRKGALKVRAKLPWRGWVDIYNTHVGAVTFHEHNLTFDTRQTERKFAQLEQLVKWVKETRSSSTALIAGDFNSHYEEYSNGKYEGRSSKEYALLKEGAGLPWADLFADHRKATAPGFTASNDNHYKTNGHFKTSPESTIDYVWISSHRNFQVSAASLIFNPGPNSGINHQKVGIPALSDHYGVLVDVVL